VFITSATLRQLAIVALLSASCVNWFSTVMRILIEVFIHEKIQMLTRILEHGKRQIFPRLGHEISAGFVRRFCGIIWNLWEG
jgi:hypothetical protein